MEYGAVTAILSIVNDLPLGHWRVEAGLRLREALFINGTLFNSEVWQGDIDEDIESLEKVDQALLRGILGAHAKIPTEALMFTDVTCQLSCTHDDTIPDILLCPTLQAYMPTKDVANSTVKYGDIFNTDEVKQKQATGLYIK